MDTVDIVFVLIFYFIVGAIFCPLASKYASKKYERFPISNVSKDQVITISILIAIGFYPIILLFLFLRSIPGIFRATKYIFKSNNKLRVEAQIDEIVLDLDKDLIEQNNTLLSKK